jgi:group I intron endonuclease
LEEQSAMMGVYAIRNTVTEERYVGKSLDIARRWLIHQKQLQEGRHHSPLLQEAWTQYGARAFRLEVLKEITDSFELDAAEGYYIRELAPVYNMRGRRERPWIRRRPLKPLHNH